jgi:hypothetical protein
VASTSQWNKTRQPNNLRVYGCSDWKIGSLLASQSSLLRIDQSIFEVKAYVSYSDPQGQYHLLRISLAHTQQRAARTRLRSVC